MESEKSKLILRDVLAIDRTKLANERTFLAYFRSAVVIISSGAAIIKLDFLAEILIIGYIFMFVGALLIGIGIARFFYVKKRIESLYKLD